MKQEEKSHAQDHVLLVATAQESAEIVSILTRSEGSACAPGGLSKLGLLLSEGSRVSSSHSSDRAAGLSASVGKTRLAYVTEDCSASGVPHLGSDGSGVHPDPAFPVDVAPGTIFLKDRDGGTPVGWLLLARKDLPLGTISAICLSLTRDGHTVSAASPVFEIIRRSHGALALNGLPLVRFRPARLKGRHAELKRIADVLGAAIGMIILLPVFLVTAVMIKLTSPGPVFFKQTRVGKNGRAFTLYKFRSMVSGDDSKHREYLKAFVEDGREAAVDGNGRKVYKITDDPRITPLGHFLRKTSLDEFPQIINVLKGEMSLAGPRPCLPYEWALYEDWQKERLSITPGLTGLWQVTGRSNVSFQDMVILDLYYISNRSFLWDLKLIFQTIPVILLGKGAH